MITFLKKTEFFKNKHISNAYILENQGFSNENWIVVADDKKYILRKLLRADVDRDFEYKVQNLTYSKSITAKPIFYDKKYALMAFEFIEGQHKQELEKEDIEMLVKVLKELHSIETNKEPITIVLKNKTKEVKKAFETIEKYPEEYVLCHNDLNPQNIFFSDKVKFIDWEYAGVNDRYFDLACVCVEFNLNDTMQKFFLDEYFKGDYKKDKLEAYKLIYVTLCAEWFASLS